MSVTSTVKHAIENLLHFSISCDHFLPGSSKIESSTRLKTSKCKGNTQQCFAWVVFFWGGGVNPPFFLAPFQKVFKTTRMSFHPLVHFGLTFQKCIKNGILHGLQYGLHGFQTWNFIAKLKPIGNTFLVI